MKVMVTGLVGVRRALGWSSKEVEFAGQTLEDLLKTVKTRDGLTLYDFLVENGEMKGDYAVIVNGVNLASGDSCLSMEIGENDQVLAMTVLGVVAGGSK